MPIPANRWWTRLLAAFTLSGAVLPAYATDINVVGLFPGKALVSINGGTPRTLSVGQKTPEGITLVAVGSDTATFEIEGKRRPLRLGQPFHSAGAASGEDAIVLSPDSTGHYVTIGAIDGKAVKFMVDTGATAVAMGTNTAERLGIAYRNGQPLTVSTANGKQPAHLVTLSRVRVGGVTLDNVEAAVTPGMNSWDGVLLGMSFIGRLSMQRDGQTLRLSRKESTARTANDKRDKVVLTETRNGMFTVAAKINGISLPFLVDTGATLVSLDATQADSIGLDYRKGTPGWSSTAGGPVRTWRVKLDSVSVGPITLYGIDSAVREGPGTGGVGLLGMSFLNRLEMQREGETLTLTKRF